MIRPSISPRWTFPQGSARAGLLHAALTADVCVEAQVGIGMKDGRLGKPAVRKSDEARPSDAVFFTATPKRTHPTADHLPPKTAQTN